MLCNTILTRELGVPVFEWVEEILRCGPIQMNSLWAVLSHGTVFQSISVGNRQQPK